MNHPDHNTTFLLADDHSLIRQGLVFILEDAELKFNVHHASNLQQILHVIENQTIDIAVIDAHFPDGNSLNIIPEIKKSQPKTKILIYTGIDEEIHALKFINAGAHGFLSKLSEQDEVKDAILKVKNDGEYISPKTHNLLMNSLRNPTLLNPLVSLTDREMEIAEMYAKGMGNLEIANELNLKQNTVSTQKKRIFEKLNIKNIVELVELMKNHR